MGARTRRGWRKVINGVNFSAFIVVLFVGLPLYWLIISSFKTPSGLGDSPPQYWPNPWSGANYSQAFNQYDFGSYFINSVIVTLCATALVVPFGTIFAASVVAVVPIGILVFIFRKNIISGLTSGAVKG